jgi:hypothetical protein
LEFLKITRNCTWSGSKGAKEHEYTKHTGKKPCNDGVGEYLFWKTLEVFGEV